MISGRAAGHTNNQMEYTIIEGLERSKFYAEYRWKRLEKHLRLPLAIGLLCWVAYLCMEVNALVYELLKPVIVLHLS